jgi:hypothetical protein
MDRQILRPAVDVSKAAEWRALYREKRSRAPSVPGMITATQAARKYCISSTTLKTWRAAGLRFKRIGHWIFMHEAEVKRWAAEYWKVN